jgi:hypothetical protein
VDVIKASPIEPLDADRVRVDRLLAAWRLLAFTAKLALLWAFAGLGVVTLHLAGSPRGLGDIVRWVAIVWGVWTGVIVMLLVIGGVMYTTGFGFGRLKTAWLLIEATLLLPVSIFGYPVAPSMNRAHRRLAKLLEAEGVVEQGPLSHGDTLRRLRDHLNHRSQSKNFDRVSMSVGEIPD